MTLDRPAAAPASGASLIYRRRLGARELLPAVGIGLGAGLAAFYIATLFLQRTPLERGGPRRAPRPPARRAPRPPDVRA